MNSFLLNTIKNLFDTRIPVFKFKNECLKKLIFLTQRQNKKIIQLHLYVRQ